jgi:glycerate 2-kinase
MSASNDKTRAREIFFAGLDAVRPQNFMQREFRREGERLMVGESAYTLPRKGRLFLFGSGKAVIPMTNGLFPLVEDRLSGGVIVSNYSAEVPEQIRLIESCHPYPCAKSVEAAEALTEGFSQMQEEDFFIYLLSGGTSALVEKPLPPVTLEDMAETTQRLLHAAIPIEKINCVRKHLSAVKGGRLARMSAAKGMVAVISDVVGDDLEAIGSAPLYRDRTTREEAVAVLQEAQLWDKVPSTVREVLANPLSETPSEAKEGIIHHLVANNRRALEAACKRAEALGMEAKIVTDRMEGEVEEVAARIARAVKETPVSTKPLCLLFGGESVVHVRGGGMGGRNQELTLHLLKSVRNHPEPVTFLSGATDGIDGNSEAAGGVVDRTDDDPEIDAYIKNNDAYHYLKAREALLLTGPTGTNVMDIMIAIKGVAHV